VKGGVEIEPHTQVEHQTLGGAPIVLQERAITVDVRIVGRLARLQVHGVGAVRQQV
jgi:hypothetical protein